MKKSECDFIFARPSGKKHLIILSSKEDDTLSLLLALYDAINLMMDHEELHDISKEDGVYAIQIKGLKNIGLGEDFLLKETLDNQSYEEMYSFLTQEAMLCIVNRIQQAKGEQCGPKENRQHYEPIQYQRTDGISSSSKSEKGCSDGTGEESE